jgi:ABC-type transport system substrate-binding protein
MRVAVAFAVLAACSVDRGPRFQRAGATSPRDGGTLRYSTPFNVSSLDPALAYDEVSTPLTHALYDTLVDYGTDLGLVPRLATSWTLSDDARVYTFQLRAGVTFSDGTPVTAADFVASIERVRAMTDSPYGAFFADVSAITALAPDRLEIQLAAPNAAFLYVLAMPCASPVHGNALLGTGPYVLGSWDPGRRLELRRNPHYWDPARSHLDAIVLYENVPRDTQLMMFEKGELDAAEKLTSPDLIWLASQPAWQPYIHRITTMSSYGARMNVRVKPFDDKRVRQALNYAIDKSHTVKLLNGSATPAHGMLIPGMLGYDTSLQPYPHDPAKARALLAAAGYPHGFDTDYLIIADDEAERIAVSMQADLAEVGVRLHVSQLSLATFGSEIARPDGPAFSYIGWIADYPDPTTFFDAKFHSRAIANENSSNDSFYANPEVDRLLDAARVERDAGRRAAMYRQVEQTLYDDAPWIWNYHQNMTEVVQPYVVGYTPHPVWLRDFTSAWLDR